MAKIKSISAWNNVLYGRINYLNIKLIIIIALISA